jgi:AAT family amino acid transporter
MLFSLSRGSYAPLWLGRLSTRGVPHRALAVSSAGMVSAILLAVFAPKNAFLMLYGTAVAGMFYVWGVILFTHLRFRQRISSVTLSALPLKLPLHPWPTLFAILAMCGIALSTFWVDGLVYTIPTFLPLLAVMSLIYVVYRSRRRKTL